MHIKKVKRKKFLGKNLEIILDQKIPNFLKCQDKMNSFWNFGRTPATPAVLEIHKDISLVYIFHKWNHKKKYSINTDVQCTHLDTCSSLKSKLRGINNTKTDKFTNMVQEGIWVTNTTRDFVKGWGLIKHV